jgi:hypothetical protein
LLLDASAALLKVSPLMALTSLPKQVEPMRNPSLGQFRHKARYRLHALVGSQPSHVVRTATVAEKLLAKQIGPERNRPQRLLHVGIELLPTARVLFRPEEIHASSAEADIFARTADHAMRITHDRHGLHAENLLVAHLDHHRLSAVETRRVDLNRLAGE